VHQGRRRRPITNKEITMHKPTAPVPATVYGGTTLPLVALPQGELLTVSLSEIPMIKDAIGPGINVQPLRIDMEAGELALMATLAPGAEVPVHYHTGPAEIYTLAGRWEYKEYSDQPQTAGSYLYEPGGSVHTFVTPADNTEDTVIFARVQGANINFNADGTFHSILDACTVRYLVDTLSESQGLGEMRYISRGEADFTAEAS
jgi:2,4'-dihydroxyacetophenone dioxygenase